MDTENAAAAASSPVSFAPSKENGGDSLSNSQPPASAAVEEDYETASESEDSGEKAAMPIEKDGNPYNILSDAPDVDEGSEGVGSGEVEPKGISVESSAADENGVSDIPDEKVEILSGGSNQKVPNSDGRDEKDEVLGGGSSPAVPNSAVEVEGEPKNTGFVTGAEGNRGDFAGDVQKDENEVNDLKPVEVEAEAGGVENGEPLPQDEEKDEGFDDNGQSKAVATSPVVEGEEEEKAELKPQMEKSAAAGSIEEPAVEAQKEVAFDIVGSDKNLEEAAEDSKPVEVELIAVDAQNLDTVLVEYRAAEEEETNGAVEHKETDVVDGSVKSKAVEEENEAVAAEKSGAADSLDAIQDFGEVAEPKAMEEEIDAVAAEKGVVPDSVNSNQVLEEAAETNTAEKDTSAADGAGPDLETEEKAVSTSDQFVTDLETKPSDGGGDSNQSEDVKPASAPAEDSTSKVTETATSENSDAVESGTARKIYVESIVPASDTTEKGVVPDSVNSNLVLEVAAETNTAEKDTSAADGAGPDLEAEEKAVSTSDQFVTDLETKPSDGGGDSNQSEDVKPASAPAEDSTSKETENAPSEDSDAVESGTAREIPVESIVPVSDTTEKGVVPDSVNSNQVLEEAAETNTAEKDTSAADGAGPDLETEEKVLSTSDQFVTDLETKLSDGGGDSDPSEDVKPASAHAEDSTSKETETAPSENSDAVESGTAREISVESIVPVSDTTEKVEPEADGSNVADDDENPAGDEAEEEEEDDNVPDQQPRVAILDSSETAKQIIKEMEKGSSSASFESSRSYQHPMDGQIVSDSDEEVYTDDEGDGKEIFDSAALAALLKAATGASSDGNITVTSQDGTRVFSADRPAGLGSSAPALRPAPGRSARPTLFSPSELTVTGEPENEMDEEERKLHEKVEDIRVKFLRLVTRLGHTPEDTVAAQVLYRLSLAEGLRRGRQMSRAFSIETAKKKAIQLETKGEEDLNFSCNILVLGKTGVGKSATINSIFGEEKSQTDAFQTATTSVREISGVVDGVKIRVIDTPGLKLSVMDQATNRRILSSIKKYTKKCPPDIVLYVDRLDTQTRDFNDLPLLRSITSALGSSIWFNAIVALTHAASAPPEGPHGSPLSYEVFIAQRSHVVQHSIRQAAGDMRLMNPVALVENHPSCRRNREGERVLPNGLSWRPQMLLLCYSSKILSEANSLLKLQDPSPGKLFGFRPRSPPLPYLLSTLLQSRTHPKLSSDQGGDNGDSDIDLDDFSDAEDEEEDEYDQLPPFKPLKKSQLAKLTKEQKRAYFDEYDYRVKLLQKKQFKEEIRRLKEMKKRGKSGGDNSPYGDTGEDFDQDGAPAAVPVPLPDMVLPPSFDCDVPTYRYRFLEPTSQLLTRPVLDTHGWDHDCGYDGVSLEESLAIANRFPAAVAVQITKDKKDFNIHLDSSVSAKHGENGSTLAGFDIQSVGKQLAYILRTETKFKNLKKNKTAAGISVTFLGETVATGLKVEDQLMIGKRVGLVASTGAVRAQGDVAYGANLEARLREKDYPIGQALSTLGLSLMKWRGDLALGANLQSQVNIGRNSKVAVRVGLNNKLSGQITVRTSTSEQLQLALVGIIPVALSVFRSIWPGELDMGH